VYLSKRPILNEKHPVAGVFFELSTVPGPQVATTRISVKAVLAKPPRYYVTRKKPLE
jgi:hypothetical protein